MIIADTTVNSLIKESKSNLFNVDLLNDVQLGGIKDIEIFDYYPLIAINIAYNIHNKSMDVEEAVIYAIIETIQDSLVWRRIFGHEFELEYSEVFKKAIESVGLLTFVFDDIEDDPHYWCLEDNTLELHNINLIDDFIFISEDLLEFYLPNMVDNNTIVAA